MRNLDKQGISKFISILLISVLLLAGGYFFITWLYSPYEVSAFNYNDETKLQTEKYSKNLYAQIINRAIPICGLCYEQRYGYKMPGVGPVIISYSTDGLVIDTNNPLTYINLAFPAFGQYSKAIATVSSRADGLPDITNFEDAPEGAIYFSEEDEYNVEEDFQTPVTPENQIVESEIEDPELIELSKKDPQVLVYHTHATESYMPVDDWNYHTLNEKYSVVGVGNVFTKNLQKKYKLNVIHDKTYHDKESYTFSYVNSLRTIKNRLKQHKSLKILVDLHRDAFAVANNAQKKTSKDAYTVEINGKKAARVMLVIGTKNENYKDLEKFAVYIKKKMDKLYPGLCLKISRPNKKYNQYNSNHSILVEMGCMLNTYEEAQYSAELMANVFGEVIKDLQH